MARFTLPRDIYFGAGAMESLKTLTGKKAIVVVIINLFSKNFIAFFLLS